MPDKDGRKEKIMDEVEALFRPLPDYQRGLKTMHAAAEYLVGQLYVWEYAAAVDLIYDRIYDILDEIEAAASVDLFRRCR
jgi:hypothetical protein